MSGLLYLLMCWNAILCAAPQGCLANDEANLIQSLLKDYDVSARPIINKSNPVIVKVGLTLQQIVNLDARSQQLEIKVWQRYEWQDNFLTWNTSEHGGIDTITLFPTRIWCPDITLYDDMTLEPNNDASSLYPSTVTNDGTVRWYCPKVIISNCNVDIYAYPWDEQKCTLKFGSWTYDSARLDMFNMSTAGDLSYYTNNGEWSILSFNVQRNEVHYDCCPNQFTDVTFTLHIRRKVLYFFANLILPTIFITFTALLVFCLPPESGEKVALSVTVLLALIVFLLIIADSVPKSETVPLIGRYFQSIILLMSLSTCLTVVTLNVHHRGVFGNKVPAWVRQVILNWMARALCMKKWVDGATSASTSTKNATGPSECIGNIELISIKVIQAQEMNDKSVGNQIAQISSETNGCETWLSRNSFGSGLFSVSHKFEVNYGFFGSPCFTAVGVHLVEPLLCIDAVSMAADNGKCNVDHQAACMRDWMLVAAVIDRFLLNVFFILAVVTTVVVLMDHSYSDMEPIA